jgi:hypothetical protein
MARAWKPLEEMEEPRQQLGWIPDTYDPEWENEMLEYQIQSGPMGELG